MEKVDVDGVDTYTYRNPCARNGSQSTFSLQFEGDEVILVDYDAPYYMLKSPVEEGCTWQTTLDVTTYTYTWHEIGTVTVPAGTFDDCWERTTEGTTQYLTYCRGVGRVSGGTSGTLTSELVDYHLETE